MPRHTSAHNTALCDVSVVVIVAQPPSHNILRGPNIKKARSQNLPKLQAAFRRSSEHQQPYANVSASCVGVYDPRTKQPSPQWWRTPCETAALGPTSLPTPWIAWRDRLDDCGCDSVAMSLRNLKTRGLPPQRCCQGAPQDLFDSDQRPAAYRLKASHRDHLACTMPATMRGRQNRVHHAPAISTAQCLQPALGGRATLEIHRRSPRTT